eukprot:scaffold22834_cov119-Isochrysis_galbana.AAC.4
MLMLAPLQLNQFRASASASMLQLQVEVSSFKSPVSASRLRAVQLFFIDAAVGLRSSWIYWYWSSEC